MRKRLIGALTILMSFNAHSQNIYLSCNYEKDLDSKDSGFGTVLVKIDKAGSEVVHDRFLAGYRGPTTARLNEKTSSYSLTLEGGAGSSTGFFIQINREDLAFFSKTIYLDGSKSRVQKKTGSCLPIKKGEYLAATEYSREIIDKQYRD